MSILKQALGNPYYVCVTGFLNIKAGKLKS